MSFLKGRVLCSEDDADSRELIVLVLKRSGYQVVCTETGTQALDLAKNERFDLFLVDNWMPEITGPDLTRLIREFNQTTPILFYSAAAFESDRQLAFEAGAQGYLTKPCGIEELAAEVDRLIAASTVLNN